VGRSAGTGSPVWFMCWRERQTTGGTYMRGEHRVTLTGRQRPYRKKGSALGSRSSYASREYTCSCGYTGWSNHIDLARLAGEHRQAEARA
jgi:hypothetical protein